MPLLRTGSLGSTASAAADSKSTDVKADSLALSADEPLPELPTGQGAGPLFVRQRSAPNLYTTPKLYVNPFAPHSQTDTEHSASAADSKSDDGKPSAAAAEPELIARSFRSSENTREEHLRLSRFRMRQRIVRLLNLIVGSDKPSQRFWQLTIKEKLRAKFPAALNADELAKDCDLRNTRKSALLQRCLNSALVSLQRSLICSGWSRACKTWSV